MVMSSNDYLKLEQNDDQQQNNQTPIIDYAKLEHPESVVVTPTKQPKSEQSLISNIYGGTLGATGAGVVASGQEILGAGSNYVMNNIADRLANQMIPLTNQIDAANITTPTNDNPTELSSGQKWINKWANMPNATVTGGVPDAAAKYNRLKNQGVVSGRMTKMYGPKAPGEETDLTLRILAKNKFAEEENKQKALEAQKNLENENFRNSPTGQALEGLNKIYGGAKHVVGEMLRGGLNGMNIANQINSTVNSLSDKDTFGAALHGGAGLASAADLASTIAPQVMRQGLRTVTGPAAIGLTTLGDLSDEYKNKEYQKMPLTGFAGVAGLSPYTMPLSLIALHERENPGFVKNTLREMGSQYSPEYLP